MPFTPETAGIPRLRQNGGVTGAAARLGDDAGHLAVAQRDDVRRQQFADHQHQRPGEHRLVRLQHFGEVTAHSNDHVAHIGQPLLDVLVVRAGKQFGVVLEQAVQGGLGRLPLLDDTRADPRLQRRIAQNRFVNAENRGFFRADLAGDLLVQGVQVRRRTVPRRVIAGEFRRGLALRQPLRIATDENLVDAIRRANCNARRDTNPFSHDQIVATLAG